MKILFKQTKNNSSESCLARYGINNCYFKKISFKRDSVNIVKKAHHHNGFEVHIVTEGFQEYEVCGKRYELNCGDFLIICPSVRHTFVSSSVYMTKYAFTFDKACETDAPCFFGKICSRTKETFEFASNESALQKDISQTLIENSVVEILVSIFRLCGIKEKDSDTLPNENAIITLAKAYIDDNIESSPTVSDVAQYCHLSTKQFTRIFHTFEGMSPGNYIIKKRVEKTERLLSDTSFTLKDISEKMNFSSEYYFNTFFTSHMGMSPGKYRKMQGK